MKLSTPAIAVRIVLLSLALIGFVTTVLPWLLLFAGLSLSQNPPKPEITYGEFPFRLEYEINGDRVVVEDTLICKYDGIGINEGQGKFRKWKEYLASGKDRIVLLKFSNKKEIYCTVGNGAYYMGEYSQDYNYSPKAIMFEVDGRFTSDKLIDEDELLEVYNIKLISWDYTPPIKNKFT